MDERVCDRCIGDDLLGREIRRDGAPEVCTFCQSGEWPTLPIADLAPRIGTRFREIYRPGAMSRDLDHQEGEPLSWQLQEMLGAGHEVTDALADWLEEHEGPFNPEDGDEPWFVAGAHFVEQEPSREPWRIWRRFAWAAQHEQRFFSPHLREMLDSLFKEMHTLVTPAEPSLFDESRQVESPFLTIEPGDELATIYRARSAASEAEAETFARAAATELGSLPADRATPGRMNAGGIVVFYGAFSEATSIAEQRPRVGGLLAIARFKLLRPVRVLDFTAFNEHYLHESVFSDDYARRAATLHFLKGIGDLIARPVQPHDELLDYVPTQVLTEYLREVHRLDGLIYPSAQTDACERVRGTAAASAAALRRESNIVLFHHASRVEGGCVIADDRPAIDDGDGIADSRVPTLALDAPADGSWLKTPVRLVRASRVAVDYQTMPLDTEPERTSLRASLHDADADRDHERDGGNEDGREDEDGSLEPERESTWERENEDL